jgi:FAD:protein FMN transferase
MPERPGLRFAEPLMGTVFSFDIRGPLTAEIRSAAVEALAWLHQVDAMFSPYRPDSAISRIDRGETSVDQCPPEVAEVLEMCAVAREATEGWFSETASGRLDPSGLVKGWAVRGASDLLYAAGAHVTCVNGGGDLQFRGAPGVGAPWRAGIADPADPGGLVAVVEGADVAVATSGTAERGGHIRDPWTREPLDGNGLASATVVGPDITWADVYATAAFAMGPAAARRWIDTVDDHELLLVDTEGGLWASAGLRDPDGHGLLDEIVASAYRA